MEQRLSLLTIGVKDLPEIKKFYIEKFGWNPIAENKDILFFKMNGFLLSFFPNPDLIQEAGIKKDFSKFKHFTLAYNVNSKEEVDSLFVKFQIEKVKILRMPETTFFGAYFGTIEDIEGNVWEIACNPYIDLDEYTNAINHKDIKHLEQR
ncbi:MAG: VOC family protein [Leptospiraceae bacterium]|nr:VOC family protein [Leptospiraceae bacterium]